MKYKTLPIYGKIIYITVVVFAVTQIWKLFTVLFVMSGSTWQRWLALPANLNDFWMRPWTIVTYMFCHADLTQDPLHIVFNMCWLWWFGQYFLRTHTSRQMLSFYLSGGIFAGIFYLIVYNIFPYFELYSYMSWLVGASGAIFALMVAVALREPEASIGLNLFVKVVWLKMKWFVLITLFISFFCLSGHNIGGQVCHIGGALFGLVYGLLERKGTDICAWPSKVIDTINRWIDNLSKPRMTATKGGRREPISEEKKKDMNYNATKRSEEEKIDAILDKISKHGYDGLSAEEKQMLFDVSRRKRK